MRLALLPFILLTFLTISGCSDVEPLGNGSFALTWQVSPRGCDASEVIDVEIVLTGDDRVYRETVGCHRGSYILNDIRPGHYVFHAFGLNSRGEKIFANQPEDILVKPDATKDAGLVRLAAAPGIVDLFWTFENGRMCGANAVERIEVAAFDKMDYLVAQTEFRCDQGVGRIDSIPAGAYVIEAYAIEGNEVTWSGTVAGLMERGDVQEREVVLSAATR